MERLELTVKGFALERKTQMKRWLLVIVILVALAFYVMLRPILPTEKTMPTIVHPTPPSGWYLPEPIHTTNPADLSRA